MNIKTKQEAVAKQFEELNAKKQNLERALEEINSELLRLQGEFRLLTELAKEEDEAKKEAKPDKEPDKKTAPKGA